MRSWAAGVVDADVVLAAQDVLGAVPEVQVEVQDVGRTDLALLLQRLDGHRHVVEKAEPPAGAGRGVVSGRADRGKAGLRKTDGGRLDGPARSQGRDIVKPEAPNALNVLGRVNGAICASSAASAFTSSTCGSITDMIASMRPASAAGIVGVNLVKVRDGNTTFMAPSFRHLRFASRATDSDVKGVRETCPAAGSPGPA